MQIKCNYCGNFINDTDDKCPNCGAVNDYLRRVAIDAPTTIEELKVWKDENSIPSPEVSRIFIGENTDYANAFGIYQDEITQNFIVYENSIDRTQTIIYEGKDEAYAVNEVYQRLKEYNIIAKNILAAKKNDEPLTTYRYHEKREADTSNYSGYTNDSGRDSSRMVSIVFAVIIAIAIVTLFCTFSCSSCRESAKLYGCYSKSNKVETVGDRMRDNEYYQYYKEHEKQIETSFWLK